MTPVLEAKGINKRFEGTAALRGVDFTLERGEIHALLGENGAGKSTLSKIFAGIVAPDSGEVRVLGSSVRIASPKHAQSLGVGMVFQELDLFPHLSIAENLAAANSAAAEGFMVRRQLLHRWSARYLQQVGLEVDPSTPLRTLSVSQRQLVAIARALSMSARIILMDEPTSSLSQVNVDALFDVLAKLRREGVSIVYVSHRMEEIQQISDRITVLRDGMRVATKRTSDVTIGEMIALMVGRTLIGQPRPKRPHGTALLDVRSLETNHIAGINFRLHAGEVLGIAGLVGSGRSEIGAALFGLRPESLLDATLCNRPFAPAQPKEAIRRKFCLLPEDRRSDAIFPNMATLDNITIAVLDDLLQVSITSERLERLAITPLLSRLRLASSQLEAPIASLSGGNQQKAVMARWLLADPLVFFLDEPTRGIDIAAKEQIYALIHDLAMKRKGIILVSSELPELLRCCDRILVLKEGRQSAILEVETTTQEEVLAFATLQARPPRITPANGAAQSPPIPSTPPAKE